MSTDHYKTIVRTLKEKADFKEHQGPLPIKDTEFEFNSWFVGPKDSKSIVLVVEITEDSISKLSRLVRVLSRSLIRIRSSRSLTLITTGLNNLPKQLREIEMYCRVINIFPTDDVTDSIAELLPINIPEPEELKFDANEILKEKLNKQETELLEKTLKRAEEHKSTIEKAALDVFETELLPLLGENNDQ